jgi:hypothetical protein
MASFEMAVQWVVSWVAWMVFERAELKVDHWVATTAERKGDATVEHQDEKMVDKRVGKWVVL